MEFANHKLGADVLCALLKQQPGGVLIEGENRKIVFANSSFCEVFGIAMSPEQLLGLACPWLLAGARKAFVDGDAFLELTTAAAAQRQARYDEFQLRDGRTLGRDYIPLISPLRGHMWIYRDISAARESSARLLRRVDEAVSADRAKSSFLATMSHEIRTPLNAIVGMAELANRTSLTAEQRGYVASIKTSSAALMALINDVLDFSKIEAGHLDIERVIFDPSKVIVDVVTSLGVRANSKGVDIWARTFRSVPARVWGDPARLSQAIMNLVGNAVKFTDRGQVEVRLDAGPVQNGRAMLRLQVIDTGPGVPKDKVETIFERFSQLERGPARRRGGSGLGLTISRSLVSAMDGRIYCTSVEGKGATFTIELPAPVAESDESRSRYDSHLGGKRVALCGVRNTQLQAALVGILTDAGVTSVLVDAAERGPVPSANFDAAIVDVTSIPDTYATGDAAIVWLAPPAWRAADNGTVLAKPLHEARVYEALCAALSVELANEEWSVKVAAPLRRSAWVLVVEDQRANRQVVCTLLEDLGDRVDVAPDGRRAVAAATHNFYDLVLMDIEMGDVDGLEATLRIRELEAVSGRERTPIVALTAHATEDIRRRSMQAGMDDFLSKPVDPARLADAVTRWADPRPRLLIVDDSPEHRRLMKHYLESERGYRPCFAGTGELALSALSRYKFDAVLLDMEMRDLPGEEIVRAIRERGTDGDVPILAMTTESRSDVRKRFMEAGSTLILSKPLRQQNLMAGVARVLSSSSPYLQRRTSLPARTLRSIPSLDSIEGRVVRAPESMRELVEEYLTLVRTTIDGLRDLIEEESFESIRREAHNLKGSGGAYGFDAVTMLGGELGVAARSGNTIAMHGVVDRLRLYLDEVVVEFVANT